MSTPSLALRTSTAITSSVAAPCSPSDGNAESGKSLVQCSPITTASGPVLQRLPSVSRRTSVTAARELIPTPPASTPLAPRALAATAPPASIQTPAPLLSGGGPTSSSYVVPPRPKPGRKPAVDEPATKRKAQNRESQRAFRARKAAKMQEMQVQVETVEYKHKEALNEKINELHQRDLRILELEALLAEAEEYSRQASGQADFWRNKFFDSEHFVSQGATVDAIVQKSSNTAALDTSPLKSPARTTIASESGLPTPAAMDIDCTNCSPSNCLCLKEINADNAFLEPIPQDFDVTIVPVPANSAGHLQTPTDIYADREFDFTTTSKVTASTQPGDVQDSDMLQDCGFCENSSYCLCKDKLLEATPEHPVEAIESDAFRLGGTKQAATGPGSCAACQADPKQRAWCQRIAELKAEDRKPLAPSKSRKDSLGPAPETMEPRITDASTSYGPLGKIGCSEAFKLLDGRIQLHQDKLDWATLKPISAEARRGAFASRSSRSYSALELDTAGVIATLSSTMQPIEPRPSDGENAHLVRAAQDIQMQSVSKRSASPSLALPSLLRHASEALDGDRTLD